MLHTLEYVEKDRAILIVEKHSLLVSSFTRHMVMRARELDTNGA
ncbi:MAG: hypothetical protein U5O39_13485 [Gammaproteobacteria bacterium]|nr:hypothetical protein [Gammaproteobacteria bacterium]